MTQASGSGEMTGKEGASEWEKKGFEPLRFKPGMVQFKVSVTLRHRGDSTPAIFANKDDRMLSLQKTKAEAEEQLKRGLQVPAATREKFSLLWHMAEPH